MKEVIWSTQKKGRPPFVDISIGEIQQWILAYQDMGVTVAFILPIVEAFFPILPLIAIVTGNAAAFGLWQGFIFTWLGACTGSILTFWLVRKFGGNGMKRLHDKYKPIAKTSHWLEEHGFSVLFLLRCFPFSPSSFINILAGLSSIPFHTYFWATVMGKAIMIFILSYIGADFFELWAQPWKLLLAAVLILSLWLAGKKVEKSYLKS